jgi:hypothetical protein
MRAMKLSLGLPRRHGSVIGMLLASGIALQAQSVLADTAVMPVEARNVAPNDADVIARLFADSYAVVSQTRVVAPRVSAAADDFAPSPSEEAKRVNADEYVVIYATGLDQKVKLRATRYKLDGTVVHSAQMDAASLDEMDAATERLARALWASGTPKPTPTEQPVAREPVVRETYTLEERRPSDRGGFMEKVVGIKSAFFVPYATETNLAPLLGVGFDARLEAESYFVELGAGALIPSETYDDDYMYGGVYTEFGVSYYLTSSEGSPYIGAGVTPRLIFSARSNAQFAAYGQVGLMFLRSQSVRFYADMRATQGLTPIVVEEYEYDDGGSSADGQVRVRPLELGLQVGVGW